MNIACSTTVFSTRPLEDAFSRISSLGFSSVDILMMENWAHINPSELVDSVTARSKEVAALLKKHGLKAVAINTNVSGNLSSSDPEISSRNLREAEALLVFAKDLEIPVVVFQPGRVEESGNVEESTANSVEALNRICDFAKERDITIAIETHSGSLAEGYQDAMSFVSRVPGLAIAYDPSHFIMMGMDLGESSVLIPHTAHVHLRNAVKGNFQASMPTGNLDFMWVLESIDASGYRGAISIEYLDNRDEEILGDVSELKKLLDSRYSHI